MLVFDPPRPVTFQRFTTSAHLGSTLLGEHGTEELLAFGRRIGLSASWLQHKGEPGEHFDLFDGAIVRAQRAGAQQLASSREYVRKVVIPKRAALPSRGGAGPGITSIRPVLQERTGFGQGQCTEACIATLLCIGLHDVPSLWAGPMAGPTAAEQQPPERVRALVDWLTGLGWSLVAVEFDPPMGPPPLDVSAWAWPLWAGVLGYHMLGGTNSDGVGHFIVAHAGEARWDPNPAKSGLASVDAVWCLVRTADVPAAYKDSQVITLQVPR